MQPRFDSPSDSAHSSSPRVVEIENIPTQVTSQGPGVLGQIVFGTRWAWTFTRVLLLVLAFYIFWNHYFPIQITGPSMEPTFPNQSWNLIDRKAYDLNHLPQRGDVVAIEARTGDVVFLKRIIGLPGERISFFNNRVYINSEPLEEPYVILKPTDPRHAWNRRPTSLREDEYFVVGDNRSMPMRHHTHGATIRNRILGKIVF